MKILSAALCDRYASDRLVLIKGFAGAADISRIIKESTSWPKRSVYVRPEDGVTWLSQPVPQDSFLNRMFSSDQTMKTVRNIASISSPLLRTESWTNLYRAGEYISPHKDAAGTVQLLLNLESPPPDECGGTFNALIRGAPTEFYLEPGDAILFEATSVEHSTSPLRTSSRYPNPLRMTGVIRFYFAHSSI
jgi:hypothetical protein